MLRYVFKPIWFCFAALLVVIILENAYWSVYDKLSRTVKYDAVYYLAGVDTYLEINYDQKDSCANVLLRQSDSAMSNSHDLLRIRKGGIGRTSYLPFQMLFFEKTCYIHPEQTDGLISLASARQDNNYDVWNNRIYRLGFKGYLDSCKVQVYVSNQLQSAFVWYDGDVYGEYLEPVEEHRTTQLGNMLSILLRFTDQSMTAAQ